MGNLTTQLKRFLSNKNTVTLILIIVGAIMMYAFYNWRVSRAVSTTYVCAATQEISPRTTITKEMTTTKKVLTSQVEENVIADCGSVIGKMSSYATQIAKNSFFFTSYVMEAKDMPDSAFADIPDGNTIYNLKVDFNSTYGNSVFPGDFIDLYIRTTNTTSGLLVYGRFIESIKVLGVKDASGKNVFETTAENRSPAQLLFSVPEDLYLLLKKSEFLGLQIVIVPRNNHYTEKQGETYVSSDYLKQLVLEKTASIPDEVVDIKTKTGTNEGKDTTTNSTNTQSSTQKESTSSK